MITSWFLRCARERFWQDVTNNPLKRVGGSLFLESMQQTEFFSKTSRIYATKEQTTDEFRTFNISYSSGPCASVPETPRFPLLMGKHNFIFSSSTIVAWREKVRNVPRQRGRMWMWLDATCGWQDGTLLSLALVASFCVRERIVPFSVSARLWIARNRRVPSHMCC